MAYPKMEDSCLCAFSGFRQADYPIPSDKLSDSSSGIQVHVSEGIFPELEAMGLSIQAPKPAPKKRGRPPKKLEA